jgi:hypothetical protein
VQEQGEEDVDSPAPESSGDEDNKAETEASLLRDRAPERRLGHRDGSEIRASLVRGSEHESTSIHGRALQPLHEERGETAPEALPESKHESSEGSDGLFVFEGPK